jgi:hypothetical protein
MQNVEQTIISQYGNSRTMTQLIQNMNQYIDPQADIDNFYNFVWNVETAVGYGLDVWGRIVHISRELTIPDNLVYLGFDEGISYQPFGQAPFYPGETSTQTYSLADDAYRTLIMVKALANISSMTARSLNQLLQNLFAARGRCYVVDIGGMQMMFTFEFILQPFELAILMQSSAVPRPAAVNARILQAPPLTLFGFHEGQVYQPFGQGVFFNQATSLLNAA